jgi:DNA modification methylase
MTIQLITGDCREMLKGMASQSVHMICTSPPYY